MSINTDVLRIALAQAAASILVSTGVVAAVGCATGLTVPDLLGRAETHCFALIGELGVAFVADINATVSTDETQFVALARCVHVQLSAFTRAGSRVFYVVAGVWQIVE